MTAQRPSAHGAALGKALADMTDAIATRAPQLDTRCASCAFRQGTIPNQMAGTLLDALNIVVGADPATFMCHDGPGIVSGRCAPTTICAGYALARLATPDELAAMLDAAKASLDTLDTFGWSDAELIKRWGAQDDLEYARARGETA